MQDTDIPNSLDFLYDEWVVFADKTFGEQRYIGKARHIAKEAQELIEELEANGLSDHAYEEMADIFVILAHLSHDREKFMDAVRQKMDKNYRRQWQPINAEGIISHVPGVFD